MAITQEYRGLEIATPLGEDVLLLTNMSGTEQLGRPFRYELELASEDHQIKAEDIVGQNVTIRLDLPAGSTRFFNGYISRFTRTPPAGGLARYRASVVPWLWFLTRTADCRIFQEMTVPDIIETVFRDHGFTDFERSLSGSYRTWEYCVQYRETDFNFVSRLMEQEGIYYFFKHEDGKHLLVLADSAGAHDPYPEFEQLEYHPADKGTKTEECISDWVIDTYLQPGAYALKDFDFKAPKKDLNARAMVERKHEAADYEIYDYPGEYSQSKEGEDYATRRIQELQAQSEVVTAGSDARGICTGYTFTLTDHPHDDQNRKYLITSADYNIDASEFYSGGEGGGGCVYSCSFTAIDAKQPFRPLRITPKPSIPGPQTAIVVGPSGEEIYTDEYGRVKVQFHWDREGKTDENSSCWIRVAQVWAGKNWGAMYIPRIGQEVIVEFLEGDPDQPIITGRVYNAEAMPPYELPSEKTKSTLKSDSSKGGQGFNEIRFEDKKDSEQIFVHAQKDRDIVVENDETHSVGNNREKSVANDENTTIGNNRTEKVGKNESITIGESRTETVGKNESISIGASRNETVSKDESITISENRTKTVGKNESSTIGENRSHTVGKTESVEVGDDRIISVGKNTSLNVGKKLQINAGDQIILTTGSAMIVMKKSGDITIKGKKIDIKASGDIKMKGSKIAEN